IVSLVASDGACWALAGIVNTARTMTTERTMARAPKCNGVQPVRAKASRQVRTPGFGRERRVVADTTRLIWHPSPNEPTTNVQTKAFLIARRGTMSGR